MDNPIVARRQAWLTERDRQGSGMSTCRIAGLTLGALFVGIVLSQVPDIIRYVRIARM